MGVCVNDLSCCCTILNGDIGKSQCCSSSLVVTLIRKSRHLPVNKTKRDDKNVFVSKQIQKTSKGENVFIVALKYSGVA